MLLSDLMSKIDELINLAFQTGYDSENKLEHFNNVLNTRDEFLDMLIIYSRQLKNE